MDLEKKGRKLYKEEKGEEICVLGCERRGRERVWWEEGWLWRLLKGSDSEQQPKRAKAGAQFGKEWWERHSKGDWER